MKKSILIIVTLFILLGVSAQKWSQTIGEPSIIEQSRRLIEHYDKGYLVTAVYSDGYDGHCWILKTDINGNILWDKKLGIDPDITAIDKTIYDAEGNLYLIGLMVQNTALNWPVTIKLNACGEKQWCTLQYHYDHEDGYFSDALLLDNGDLLAMANMQNTDQSEMIYLMCLSPDGEYKWRKSYASREDHPTFDIRFGKRFQQFNDLFIISGYVYSPHPSNPNIVSQRPMFIGIDTLFNEQWVLEFGLEDNMKGKAHSTIAINDSLFMGTGRYRYNDNTGEAMDGWAMYYNDEGEQVGYTTFTKDKLGPEVNESTFFAALRVNDSIYMGGSGYFYGEDDIEGYGEIVFDTAGNVYNYTIREGVRGGQHLIKTFDNKYTIASNWRYPNGDYDLYLYKINDSLEHEATNPGNFTYDSLCSELPIQSGLIDLTGCDVVTNIKEIPTLKEYNNRKKEVFISAFPNPTSDGSVTFSFENTEYFKNMELKCFDVFGKQMHTEKVFQFQGESQINMSNWQKGIYFVILYANGEPAGECKFVVN